MRHHDVPAGLIALLSACSGSKAVIDARPAPVAVVTADAQASFAGKIDALMSQYAHGPGCAVGVVQHGALTFARGYGFADVASRTPIDATTTFDLASTSKQFTAALVLQLVAEGKLALDDPMTKYVPELKHQNGRAITIADLLHHTSGLPDYIGLMDAEYADSTTWTDALDILMREAPVRRPGVKHDYSNSGYFVLGLIVERVEKQPLPEVAQARIFGPLGMTHTKYDPGGQSANGYDGDQVVTSGWTQVGDGGVVSSVEDLAKWAAAPLTPAQLEPGKLDDGTELDYAAGLYLGDDGTISHSGSWVGFGAELLRVPDEDLAVICLCNFEDSDPESLAREIRTRTGT